MVQSFSNNKDRIIKLIFLSLGEAFAVFSVIRFAIKGEWILTAWAVLSVFMLFIPVLAERILRHKLTVIMFIGGLLYSLGPSLGHSYYLYHIFPWWDELLHFAGGLVFAFLGFELVRMISRGKPSDVNLLLTALFGLFFSISLSVVWEFAEYGMDLLFGLDMQGDTIIHSISSYNLSTEPGITGNIGNIEDVIINGIPLDLGGYLDIGLHDTMTDLLTEAAGAVISVICFAVSKGRLTIFRNN